MPEYQLTLAHLYGNLLNTYGDNGNVLMLKYVAEKMNVQLNSEIISVHETFDPKLYDLVFFGGGQDYEQFIVSKDIQEKKESLIEYIENDGVMLAICGGYQLLGHYYTTSQGERISGISALDHYTLNQDNNRFIGDIKIYNQDFDETYYGFENHNGLTFLGKNERPLGKVIEGYGNNGKDHTEGVIYHNVYGSYFHGPILARNETLARRLIKMALNNKYGANVSPVLN